MTHHPVSSSLRKPDHPVNPAFINRWSPRSFVPKPMPDADLKIILEAARWAPSAFNVQPWRFVYAHRDDAMFQTFLDLLIPFNKSWAHTASALVFVISDTIMPGDGERPDQASAYHAFDSGAAWAHAALQATMLGYHAHATAIGDKDAIRKELGIPERFDVQIAFAVGKLGDPADLPDGLREREIPSTRRALADTAWTGQFKG